MLLGACSSYNPDLLKPSDNDDALPGGDAAIDGAAGGVAGSAGAAGTGPVAGVGGTVGVAGDSGVSGTGGTVPVTECQPNPNPLDEVCPEICPERCNGLDDDCDRHVDEAEADADCVIAHNTGVCLKDEGRCLLTGCLDGYRDCDELAETGCEVAADDPAHCGQCNLACVVSHGTPACVSGVCGHSACDPGYADCDADATTCETATSTLSDCGGCGVPCDGVPNATPSCDSGSCGVGECNPGFGDCDAQAPGCEQDLSTLSHCGACGQRCDLLGSDDECVGGVCFAQNGGCEFGYGQCDNDPQNGCEPLTTDADCGACGALCDASLPNAAAETACAGGQCELYCQPGWGACDIEPNNGCETKLDSNTHCQQCGTACTVAHGTPSCATGSCGIAQCDPGWGDCVGGAADGCETPTDTTDDCGGCAVKCAPTQTCSGGKCSDVDCGVAPWSAQCGGAKCGNCDGDQSCETDIAADLDNCGACGNKCEPQAGAELHGTLGCTLQGCKVACAPSYADCDGDYKNGCEQSLQSLGSCGACGQSCSITNATASCATGACEVASCNTDYEDCDGDKKSCETQLNAPGSCGGCTTVCSLPNAVEGCGGSPGARVCTIAACEQSYYKNCDGALGNGCEIDTRSDKLNCGACGTACEALPNVATASCAGSACSITTCDAGYGDCTAAAGCETQLNTVQNCGACGNNCDKALANTASTSCDAGTLTCKIGGCDAGYADCDNVQSTGCETSTTTAQNCGACGNDCTALPHVATTTCGGGTTCQVTTCQTDWGNCDGSAANGCERDVRQPASGGLGPCLPDTGCLLFSNAGHDYYFCPTARDWAAARAKCQLQRYGDLARLDSAAENTFVQSHLTAASWIGHNDNLVEGLWVWADNGAPFWQGTALFGRYANWDTNEPNNSGDCGQIYSTNGKLDDTTCTAAKPFVCEVSTDDCPNDPAKYDPGQCGCGVADTDADSDGYATCNDGCASDPAKIAPGACGCGVADTNTDGDSQADCNETCDTDPNKLAPGQCGCGVADTDTDGDGTANCNDGCPNNAPKTAPGACGCAVADTNTDGDSQPDCNETCDTDPNKLAPGQCGCGVADTNTDGDSQADCNETCDTDPNKLAPGVCGCGVADTDSDGDGFANCVENCDNDPAKQDPGACGCGVADTNTDGDSQADCNETCDTDPNKLAPGQCGCGVADTNTDGDTQADCVETCDSDPNKLAPGACGCGNIDTDTDADGTANCNDSCPFDAANAAGCFGYASPNVSPVGQSFASSPTWNCSAAGTTTIDSTAGTITSTSCTLGTLDFTNNVAQKQAGLTYSKITGGWFATGGTPVAITVDPLGPSSTELSTEVASGSSERWVDGTTYVYSGEIYITASGVASFMEHIDDNVYLKIDSTVVLNDTNWSTPSAGKFVGTPGWHTFELRVYDGSGEQGPSANAPGLPAFGYSATDTGLSTSFASYVWPRNVNATTPSLFRTALTGGPNVMVVRLKGLTVASGHTVKLVGNKPVVLLVAGNATIGGVVDANGSGTTAGAGGNWSCGSSAGGSASGGDCTSGAEGGGGGGFGTAGGSGGNGGGSNTIGAGGAARGATSLTPLYGGCAGGNGGGDGADAQGGAGGGAAQLSVAGALTITGTVRANGAAGATGSCGNEAGGAGGGSGGAILLHGSAIDATGATITVNGGNGGTSGSGAGGGAGSTSSSGNGAKGADDGANGGGGGGGGYGRRLLGAPTCTNCPFDPPAAPDTNCSYFTNAGHGYYFCTNAKTWTAARDLCRASTTKMQLVRIDSSAENTFVDSHLASNTWIGGNDLGAEGAWRWAELSTNSGPQFWSGKGSGAGGAAVGGLYSNWEGTAEPNDSGGNEDCAEIDTAALWNDASCTTSFDFACEYTP